MSFFNATDTRLQEQHERCTEGIEELLQINAGYDARIRAASQREPDHFVLGHCLVLATTIRNLLVEARDANRSYETEKALASLKCATSLQKLLEFCLAQSGWEPSTKRARRRH